MSETVPVRAILEGWDVVERAGQLSPLWKKLRRIDELQFSGCADTERLAILTTMHMLLRYHAEPTLERARKLPMWLMKR